MTKIVDVTTTSDHVSGGGAKVDERIIKVAKLDSKHDGERRRRKSSKSSAKSKKAPVESSSDDESNTTETDQDETNTHETTSDYEDGVTNSSEEEEEEAEAGDDDESDEDDEEDEDDIPVDVDEVLNTDILWHILSRMFTSQKGRNVADILEDINKNLETAIKLSHTPRTDTPK